jgi:hypothetical protein
MDSKRCEGERLSRTGERMKPKTIARAKSRDRSHRTSLSDSVARKVAARALCETVSQPRAEETGRRLGPLRQQPHGDHRQMRRPPDHRIIQSSGPPSWSRRSSQLEFVMKPMVEAGNQRAVGSAQIC